MILITLAAMAQTTTEGSEVSSVPGATGIADMVLHAGPVVQAIMAGLLGLSLICWGIIVAKGLYLRQVNRESETFAGLFLGCVSLEPLRGECERFEKGHIAHIFRVGCAELNRVNGLLASGRAANPAEHAQLLLENVDRALQAGVISKRKRLQRLLPFLATTGSTAPFIGLFGTVWGIMTSFREIGLKGSANLAVVAPGIAEALVATAMGLAAAIPAVVAYNHFSNKIQLMEDDMLQFSSDFLNRLKTDLASPAGEAATGTIPIGITRERRGICGCMEADHAQTG